MQFTGSSRYLEKPQQPGLLRCGGCRPSSHCVVFRHFFSLQGPSQRSVRSGIHINIPQVHDRMAGQSACNCPNPCACFVCLGPAYRTPGNAQDSAPRGTIFGANFLPNMAGGGGGHTQEEWWLRKEISSRYFRRPVVRRLLTPSSPFVKKTSFQIRPYSS